MGDRNIYQKGYEEVTPHQVANELLKHLPMGSYVALTARGKDKHVQEYIDILTQQPHNFQVRVTPEHHTGVQDFCFLLQTQNELVGGMRSTYTRWAALLGQAKKAHLYSIHKSNTRQAHGNATLESHYQWKGEPLKSKIVYHEFASQLEEQAG